MEDIKKILSQLNIPNPAQDIYITLLNEGEASARTISHRTSITRTSVYDHVKILRTKNLIIERAIEGSTLFAINDARQLSILFDEHIEKLTTQQKFLANNLDTLIQKTQSVQPKIRFFEGEDGVKQLLKDILWHDNITLFLYWPYEDMLTFLGEDFLLWFSKRRKAHNIDIKTIWGHQTKKQNASHIFTDDEEDVERRHLIKKDISTMSYIIYDTKVAFISSHKESFGFIVDSTEFSSLMKMQFNVLWNAAKK